LKKFLTHNSEDIYMRKALHYGKLEIILSFDFILDVQKLENDYILKYLGITYFN